MIKLRLAINYMKLVRSSRHLVMQTLLLAFCMVLLAFGLVMLPVSLCLFMPWNATVKAIVSVSFGLLYTITPLIVIMVAFSRNSLPGAAHIDTMIKSMK